jgi:hypothetical protein
MICSVLHLAAKDTAIPLPLKSLALAQRWRHYLGKGLME